MNDNVETSARRDDPWLTLGEIAQELRVNPATVRLWVGKGQLAATRAGMRKWIVRRSELERMLGSSTAAGRVPEAPVTEQPSHSDPEPNNPPAEERLGPQFLPPVGTRESVKELVHLASENVRAALTASALAPPSAGYLDRLRAIADGFEHLASTLLHAARTTGSGWAGRDDWWAQSLPYELRPDGNRPTHDGLWDRFDTASTLLGEAIAGNDLTAVGQAFRGAADELFAVCNRLADTDVQRADSTVG